MAKTKQKRVRLNAEEKQALADREIINKFLEKVGARVYAWNSRGSFKATYLDGSGQFSFDCGNQFFDRLTSNQ